jgi:hypothetical protein
MSPTLDTVVSEYEQALIADDWPQMHGILIGLVKMSLNGHELGVVDNARETIEAVLLVHEAHRAIAP